MYRSVRCLQKQQSAIKCYKPATMGGTESQTGEYCGQKSDLTSLFISQPEDHRPMWYIHTITGEHRY